MTFDIQKIFERKRQFRRELAALPIEEKLRLLDTLRERQLAIDRCAVRSQPDDMSVESSTSRTQPE